MKRTVEELDAPQQPDWPTIYSDELDQMAAAEAWAATIREMREAGTLARGNGHAVRRLVDFRVAYDRAARQVAELGPVLKAKRAKVGQWNPFFSVMTKASVEIRAIEAELGLSPMTRDRAGQAKSRRQRPWTASDDFINPAGKYFNQAGIPKPARRRLAQ